MSLSAHWYVYDGSQVSGPYSVEKLEDVKRQSDPALLANLLITKRGLNQWHPFGAFDELTGATREPVDALATQKQALTQSLQESLERLHRLEGSRQAAVAAFEPSQYNRRGTDLAYQKEQTDSPVEPATEHPAFNTQVAIDALPLRLNYLLVRGRQRLGDERNSFAAGFIYTIFSLGFYIPIWIRTVYRELNWHLHNDLSLTGLPNPVLLCTPGYQAVVFYRLARFLQLAEGQLEYQKTNPKTAALLGILPPFGIFYLQRRFNDYWHRKAQLALSVM